LLKTPRTIYAKGLILITIPLLLELAFGLTMFSLQHYYQDKLQRERIASEIIFHANEMWINCSEVMLLQAAYTFLGGPKPPVEDRIARLEDEYSLLRKLVVHDSVQAQNLEKIWNYTCQAVDRTRHLRPLFSKDRPASAVAAGVWSTVDSFKAVYDFVLPILPAIHDFSQPEFILHGPRAIREVERAALLVDWLVLASLSASILAAMVLFIFFMRTINKGVTALVENTDRFRRAEELKPPVGGVDELAQVDAAFHEMADEIREAQRTKQAVLAMISHDLRSPLTSILGNFGLLAHFLGDAPEATRSAIEKQERDIDQLIRLINDLLELEKIEAEKLSLQLRMLPITQVLERAISAVEFFADQNGVIIRGVDSSAEICADPDRIVQAIANLILTAVKVSPEGSCIGTSVIQHEDGVEIRVTSACTSVSANLLNSLFDRYQERESGFGLELPLSKEITRLHGGTIGVVSGQKDKLTFWLRLPSTQAQDHALTA
jgi:signal transduction histidine kinase